MARNSVRRFGKTLTAIELLTNQISSKTMSNDSYREQVATFLANEPDHLFESSFKRLEKSQRFMSQLTVNSKKIEQFSKNAFGVVGLSSSRLWLIYRTLIKRNAEKISDFINLRDRIERFIIIGDYEKADSLLKFVSDQFGESLWYVRTKILILSEQDRTTELQEFCETSKARSGGSLISYIFHCCQLITDSDNASILLNSLVFRTANEFQEGNFKGVASLLEMLFVPYPIKKKYNYLDSLERIQFFPLVDQYTLLLSLIKMAIAEEKATGERIIENLGEILTEIRHFIKDPQLQQMFNLYSGESRPQLSEDGEVLLHHYESGNYSEVVKYFENIKEKCVNPLAYINIVAKAEAHSNIPDQFSTTGNLLQSLRQQLTAIYRLDELWQQAEEAIMSSAIKYHYFSSSSHIELSLYKVLPNKYVSSLPELAAYIAVATTSEVTPLTIAMCNPSNQILEDINDLQNTAVPIYRELKRQILYEIQFSDNYTDLDEKFEKLRVITPLKKDYLELLSSYLLYTNQHERLITAAAESLVQDIKQYVCFPLETLMTVIEERRLSSLNAVTVAYMYNRNISQDLDYVLHEAFEEYLQNENVAKPSELLAKKNTLSQVELVFFKNICVPEVMDFLSCFENTNDLRAERVRLLDQLLELNVLDTDSRMREVEEIVGQVIIDAGTSDFNGPKIFVDDQAIRKKHADEMKALLAVYRQSKDNSEERFTVLGKDFKSNGLLQGYVSGNKNTAVLKMSRILVEAFQYDEKYGLDKNLSAEIRHGFFSNLMRARLEEWKLITEANDAGEYQKNVFWRERNSLLREEFWTEIEAHLKRFSENFNQLIVDAEDWMKIVNAPDQESRVFSYVIGKTDFDRIKDFVDAASDSDKISSFIMQIMWNITESHLETIRDRINGEFRDKVDGLFEELEVNIKTSKKTVPLVDLMNAIGHARSEIKEDITTAAEWFRRRVNLQLQSRSLDRVVEIALSSFEQVKGGAFAIERNILLELRAVEVPGRSVKPLIIAITNLLDNCYRRSGLGHATRVEVSGELCGGGANVIIKNDLSNEKAELLTDDFLIAIEQKIHSPEARNLMRTEGGSGLIKAYNEIASCGPSSSLSVFRDKNYFSAVISYEC